MFRRFSTNFILASLLLDMSLAALSFSLAMRWTPVDLDAVPSRTVYAIITLVWFVTFLIFSVYDPERNYKAVNEFQTVGLATGFAGLLLVGLLYYLAIPLPRAVATSFLIYVFASVLGWRVVARVIFRISGNETARVRVLILGGGDIGLQIATLIQQYGGNRLHLIGFLDDEIPNSPLPKPLLGDLSQIRSVIATQNIREVIMAFPHYRYDRVNQLIAELHDMPVQVRLVPDYLSLSLYRANLYDFAGIPLIHIKDPTLGHHQRLIKRLMDLALCSILLVLLLPIMALIALAIRIDSKGPILFKQERVGENGHRFQMHKFRSMVSGAESFAENSNGTPSIGELRHKRPDDPRVTRVGRFIRRSSLDELPQLFNVIMGEMSLVGPRPEMPWLVEQYEAWQRKRLVVPQGMTGWWQVNGRANRPMHLSSDEDLYYIHNYSLWLDLYILLKTPLVVLRGEGAF